MPVSISGTNGVTFPDSSLQAAAASPNVLKNRIINGDMRIAQRGTSSVNTDASYPVDRFYMFKSSSGTFTSQQSSIAPAGFKTSLLCTVTSPDASPTTAGREYGITQNIEGYNVADMEFGNSNAKTITLSFWVRSSLTGTFGGSFSNNAYDRGYGFTYTINSADTWEQKSITFVADTSGTWVTDNGTGLRVRWSFGAGSLGTANVWGSWINGVTGQTNLISTSGATFYITGVQLEIGTSATPFERRLYNQELANCQRYYWKDKPGNNFASFCMGSSYSATTAQMVYPYKVTMRTQPTLAVSGVTIQSATTSSSNISSVAGSYVGYDSALLEITTSGFTARNACWMNTGSNGSTAYVEGSAEL
jgi:hypothetical protein